MLRSVVVVAAVGAAIALASIAHASAPSDTILSGTTLLPGQSLKSTDGHYMLAMQTDGNLVLYWMNGGAIGHAMWSTGTHGDDGARAVLQPNGNLVLYSSSGQALWSSNTSGAGCSNLVVQGDGNLVLYNSSHSTWSTGTVQHELTAGDALYPGTAIYSVGEQYEVTMQTDGNFVLYGPSAALWSSRTDGILGSHAIMRADGNLAVVSNGGRDLWYSHTGSYPGAYAVAQSDGNFVIYAGGKARWDTATNGRKPSSGPSRYPKPAFIRCPPPPPPLTTTTTTTTSTTTVTTTTTTTPHPPSKPDPVVLVPTPTRFPRLRVRIVMHWTWDYGVTHLRRVSVPRMPHNATFAIDCKGRGCRGHARVGARRLGRLIRRLDGHAYRAGDRILITITERRHKAERVEIEIRYGRGPRARLL